MADKVLQEEWNLPSGVPGPVVVPGNEPLWRAAAENRLELQRCTNCGAHRYPPADACMRCASLESEWVEVPGTATVYAFSWVPDRKRSDEVNRPVLYNSVIVELDGVTGGPVRVQSNVVDAWEPGDLTIGERVELVGVPVGEGIALPCFRRAN